MTIKKETYPLADDERLILNKKVGPLGICFPHYTRRNKEVVKNGYITVKNETVSYVQRCYLRADTMGGFYRCWRNVRLATSDDLEAPEDFDYVIDYEGRYGYWNDYILPTLKVVASVCGIALLFIVPLVFIFWVIS